MAIPTALLLTLKIEKLLVLPKSIFKGFRLFSERPEITLKKLKTPWSENLN
jgi:hypothetical protein